MVTGKRYPCLHLNPWTFHFIFSLCSVRGEEERESGWVGVWQMAKANPPQQAKLRFCLVPPPPPPVICWKTCFWIDSEKCRKAMEDYKHWNHLDHNQCKMSSLATWEKSWRAFDFWCGLFMANGTDNYCKWMRKSNFWRTGVILGFSQSRKTPVFFKQVY